MAKTKNIVYVIQESPGKNILPAREFGELKILLFPGDSRLGPIDMFAKLEHGLRSIDPSNYLLLIGDPTAIALAGYIALKKTGGLVRTLKWVREEYKYKEQIMEVL